MQFLYNIFFNNGKEFRQEIIVDELTLEHTRAVEDPPNWCKLDYQQCPNCPLSASETPYCPLALSLIPLTEIDNYASYEPVQAEVILNEKTVSCNTTLQQALSSMLGLLIATSGCPITGFFKPMAWYHQPFSTREETIFRATSVYLIIQYFKAQDGETIDNGLEGLRRVYDEMHIINRAIAKRIRLAFESDFAANAIVLLDLFTKTLPIAIDESMEEIKPLFMSNFDQPDPLDSADR